MTQRPFKLVVAAAADLTYAWPATLALISAGVRSTVETICLLLGDQLPPEFSVAARDAFARAGVPFEYVGRDFGDLGSLPAWHYISRAAYGRLVLPEIATRFAARMLYLDADTLTVGDVGPLATFDLAGGTAAAVRAGDGKAVVGAPRAVSDWSERGLDPAAPFFNSGVLLVDNDAWLRERIGARVIADIRERPETATFADQGPLNAILYGRWVELPWYWNYGITRTPAVRIGPLAVSRRFSVSLQAVRIFHYLTHVKPWDPRYPPGYFARLYRRSWERFLPVSPAPSQRYSEWLRHRLERLRRAPL